MKKLWLIGLILIMLFCQGCVIKYGQSIKYETGNTAIVKIKKTDKKQVFKLFISARTKADFAAISAQISDYIKAFNVDEAE